MFEPLENENRASKEQKQEEREAQINITNTDCMVAMKDFEDNFFDLAIVDPPYAIKSMDKKGMSNYLGPCSTLAREKGFKSCEKHTYKRLYPEKSWDSNRPDKAYFDELRRVSKKQIIWGGNYFADLLPASRGWIYWFKNRHHRNYNRFSDGELAYTSFDRILKQVDIPWIGLGYLNNEMGEHKIHPTQKPVALYIWLLENYTKSNKEKILDTHLGSGSIAIAADKLGFDLWGYEIDQDYYNGALNRFNEHKRQLTLF